MNSPAIVSLNRVLERHALFLEARKARREALERDDPEAADLARRMAELAIELLEQHG